METKIGSQRLLLEVTWLWTADSQNTSSKVCWLKIYNENVLLSSYSMCFSLEALQCQSAVLLPAILKDIINAWLEMDEVWIKTANTNYFLIFFRSSHSQDPLMSPTVSDPGRDPMRENCHKAVYMESQHADKCIKKDTTLAMSCLFATHWHPREIITTGNFLVVK